MFEVASLLKASCCTVNHLNSANDNKATTTKGSECLAANSFNDNPIPILSSWNLEILVSQSVSVPEPFFGSSWRKVDFFWIKCFKLFQIWIESKLWPSVTSTLNHRSSIQSVLEVTEVSVQRRLSVLAIPLGGMWNTQLWSSGSKNTSRFCEWK